MKRGSIAPIVALVTGFSVAAEIPGDVTLEPAFGGAMFNFPLALRHAGDATHRKFVVERAGRIRIVDRAGDVLAGNFLDLSGIVSIAGEGGLLGLAFHPDFAGNGRFYVYYTFDGNPGGTTRLVTRISEFLVSADDPDQADPGSEKVILEIPQDFNNHNGGDIHFGPDGFLYIGMGDGGSGNDPCNRAQTLDPGELETDCGSNASLVDALALHGKMLRIDVDGTTGAGTNNLCGAAGDGSAGYAIPGDNPFAADPDACAEVWAYGLRNPYRWSFDRQTGDLWIADVGQNQWEEVNFEPLESPGGLNYGWKICEGLFLRGSTTNACTDPELTLPVLDYPISNEDECAVTGGFRYRGPVTSMHGHYVYGDHCSGKVWFATDDGQGGFSETLFWSGFGGFGALVGFGEDQAGQLYLLRDSGEVHWFQGEAIFDDKFEPY